MFANDGFKIRGWDETGLQEVSELTGLSHCESVTASRASLAEAGFTTDRYNKDSSVNNNGKQLIVLCQALDLKIVNGRFGSDRGVGDFTCYNSKVGCSVMLGLHYVPGGHGNHVSGHRGQNGMDMRQRGGTEWANVTGRDCRECRARFLNCQQICHGSHGADEKPSRL